jgi:hypothetical protein
LRQGFVTISLDKGASLHQSDQHEDWPAWYASYMVVEQAGTDLPS